MKQRGFTLIEMMVVIAIIGILLSIGTLEFNRYTKKANIESQVRTLYADLMEARSQAIMQKSPRTVTLYGTQMTVAASGTQIMHKNFNYPITYTPGGSNTIVTFDTQGMADSTLTVCVTPVGNTVGAVDGVQINTSMIQVGKITGGACTSGNIAYN